MDPEGPIYLSKEEIIQLHDRIIGRIRGSPGVRDPTAIETCVAQPKTAVFGRERFATVYEKAAAYCFFIVRTHPFFDGNKRAGFLAALHFLLKNDIMLVFDEDEMYEAINGVAKGDVDLEELTATFRKAGGA